MFKKNAALIEAANTIASQLTAAQAEATPEQIEIIKSGVKWKSTFVLGYFTGVISLAFQNRGLDGFVPGTAMQKVARKVQGTELVTVLGGLLVRMDTDKARKEYEHGQNAAVTDGLGGGPVMLKNYFLDKYDFDEDGNIRHKHTST